MSQTTPVAQTAESTPVSTEGYQAYTPKPEDSISTPTRPVITGNETEAELDEMNKSLGYSVVDLNPTKAIPEQTSNVDLGDKGWMNPQVETTPRPSIEQQLDALDTAQNAPTKTIPEQIVPTKTIPEQNVPKQSIPEQNAPTNAESIYNQSAETTASSMPTTAPIINNISSPTTNVVGGGKSSKLPMANVKHEESSVLKMFESRQKFI